MLSVVCCLLSDVSVFVGGYFLCFQLFVWCLCDVCRYLLLCCGLSKFSSVVVRCLFFVVVSLTVACVWFVVRWLLLFVSCLMCVVCCCLCFVVRCCLLFVGHCALRCLFFVVCIALVACCSWFVV